MKWVVRDLRDLPSTERAYDLLLSKYPLKNDVCAGVRNLGLAPLDTSLEVKYSTRTILVYEFGSIEPFAELERVAESPYERFETPTQRL